MAERIEGLSIVLDLDTIKVDSGLKDLRSSMRMLNSELKNNMSGFDRSERSLNKYQTQIDGLNKKIELQRQITDKAARNYEKMVKEHGEGSVEAQRAAREYNNQSAALNNLEHYVNRTTKEMEAFRKEQERQNSGWNKVGESLEKTGGKMIKVGDGMKNVGKSLSTYVTAPLVGLGAVALTTGVSFEDTMAKVSATSGATGSDLDQLSEKAREMGATTRFSATEAGEALYYMSLAGWDTEQMLGGLDGVMNLAAASGEDLATVSDIVTDALTAFGLEAADSGRMADVLAAASSNANTDVSGMGAAFQYVAPIAGSLGFSIEDTAVSIGLLADNGIKGQKAGTNLRAMMTRLVSPTGAAADTMAELGLEVANSDGSMRSLDDIMKDLRGAIGHLDEEQQAQIATTLFGQQAMGGALAIINSTDESYDALSEAVNGAEGSAKAMAETMEDTTGGSLRELRSMLEEVSLQLFDQLAPAFRDTIEQVKEGVQWFSDLSEETKENVVQWGLLAAAMGPVLIVSGTLISSIGKILVPMGSLLKLIAAKGGLTASLTLLGGKIGSVAAVLTGPWGLGIAAAITAGIGLYNHFRDDAIPAVEDFGDTVSEETSSAVTSFLDMSDGVQTELDLLFTHAEIITDEGAAAITQGFNDMGDAISEELQTDFENSLTTLSDFFNESSVMNSQNEQTILTRMEQGHSDRQSALQKYEDRAQEIMETAKEEKRALTQSEHDELTAIRENMNKLAVQYMSESEAEQIAIMESLERQSGAINARQAADTVKKSKEAKEGAIAEADTRADEIIKTAIYERDVTGTISEEEADAIIEEAERQRREAIKKAEDKHDRTIDLAQSQAEEHVKHVNWETGEILSNWDVLKRDSIEIFKTMGERIKTSWQEDTQDVREKTAEAGRRIKESWRTDIADVREKAKEGWSRIKESWREDTADVREKSQEAGRRIRTSWQEDSESVKATFSEMGRRIKESWREDTQDVKDKAASAMEFINSVPGKISREWDHARGVFKRSVANFMNAGLSAVETGVNSIIRGINWVFDKLGSSTRISSWNAPRVSSGSGTSGSTQGRVRAYAHGTDHHHGGPAVVGDGGMKELIIYPNGHLALSPDKDTLVDMPRGTQVLSGRETKSLMDDFGVPAYKDGIGAKLKDIGGQIWNWVSGGAKNLLNKALDWLGIGSPTGPGIFGSIAKAAFGAVKNKAFGFVENFMETLGPPGGINFSGLRRTSGYGPRRSPGGIGSTYHRGVDFAGPMGTVIPSQTAGVVSASAFHRTAGNYVNVKQGAFTYRYLHNLRNLVGVGQRVNKGQPLALLGSTGASTGPHVHFEILRNGRHIDPTPFIGGFEDGGLVNTRGIYELAEGGFPEFVIPTDPGKRTDAMKLLALAAKRIQGNKKPNELPSTSNNGAVKEGDTYNIHLTVNGDLPQSAINRMADRIEEAIKRKEKARKMSKGGTVNVFG